MNPATVNEREALGIDIGGVIVDRVSEDEPEEPRGPITYAGVAAVDGAFGAIARLVGGRFRDRVWLVSRCNEWREPAIVEWLEQRAFFASTGVGRDRVRFCRREGSDLP